MPQARNEPDVYETSDVSEDDQADFEAVRPHRGPMSWGGGEQVSVSVPPHPAAVRTGTVAGKRLLSLHVSLQCHIRPCVLPPATCHPHLGCHTVALTWGDTKGPPPQGQHGTRGASGAAQ